MEIARALHAHAVRSMTGVLAVHPRGGEAKERRLGLRQGLVVALDAGPNAPVSAEAQLRYLLRQRGRPEFSTGALLSARHSVEEFRPDLCIRQHIDAQALSPDPLRQRIATQRIAVSSPPHSSSLHVEEQAVVRFLSEPRTVPELLEEGARANAWSPLRAMRFLVVLDALGVLLIGEIGGPLAEAHALLGLDGVATADEVKLAYRRLARTLHPDSHPDLDAAGARELTDRFTAVHAAYRLLLGHKTGGR
jgi:hypothetical protein